LGRAVAESEAIRMIWIPNRWAEGIPPSSPCAEAALGKMRPVANWYQRRSCALAAESVAVAALVLAARAAGVL
jgi:hypothetical protein